MKNAEIVKHNLDRVLNALDFNELQKDRAKEVFDFFSKYPIYYVGSFTNDADSTFQWRTYADRGRGLAIGFSRQKIDEYFKKNEDVHFGMITPVSYFPMGFDAGQVHLGELIRLLQGCNPEGCGCALAGTVATLKDDQFLGEREIRLVMFAKPKTLDNEKTLFLDKTDFRVRNSNLIPYTTIPITGFVNEVVLPPERLWYLSEAKQGKPFHPCLKDYVARFLEDNKQFGVKITSSKHNYRD